MCASSLDDREARYQIARIRALPPLSNSIRKLLEIINSQVESANELESLVKYDQALAVKVLKIANSTFYGCRKEVRTLAKAIVLIGFDQVKSVCLSALLVSVLSSGAPIEPVYRERLWKHSFAVSRIAMVIAGRRPWLHVEEASVLGLIHDIGLIIMALYFREQFTWVMEVSSKRNSPHWNVEMQAGLTHTELGRILALRWALPEMFQAVVEFHHSPDKSLAYNAETRLIHLADVLSNSTQYPELLEDEETLASCRELHIPEDEWQEYHKDLHMIWHEIDQLWNLLN
jgi:HD-like signal output (HDOD) protein